MLKGGQGLSSGKRRLIIQGARLLTCKSKRTGDGCHKDHMQVAFLKATEHAGNMAGIPLLQTSSKRSMAPSFLSAAAQPKST